METFHNFQHLLTHIFSSNRSSEAIVEPIQSTNESLDPESSRAQIPRHQQEIETPNTVAVGDSINSNHNGQESESPRRRLSSQQQVARNFRVSKTPSPPLRRSPRNTAQRSNRSSEVVDDSIASTNNNSSQDQESPRAAHRNSQKQIEKVSRVSKPPSPPLRRSPRATGPRTARHGSIPSRCCEYVDEATQQRCGNFEGYKGIEMYECMTRRSHNHREFGESYLVCEPCRIRVSQILLLHTDVGK